MSQKSSHPLDRVARVLEARLPGVRCTVDVDYYNDPHVTLYDADGWYRGTYWHDRQWAWRIPGPIGLMGEPVEGTGLRRLVAVAGGGGDGE